MSKPAESGWRIPPEPYRIKSVEPIKLLPPQERRERLAAAGYNPFQLRSQDVFIDLLTDSGTGAMSTAQWAALMMGDESYAGSQSWEQLRETIKELTGAKHIFPVHQGRAGENILFSIIGGRERVFISNGHFDTTRANIEWSGAQAIDLPAGNRAPEPFGGCLDIDRARKTLQQLHHKAAGIILTLTNNTYAGQPVSIENITATRKLCDEFRLPLIMDIARIAENSYFIHKYELPNQTPWQIAQKICRMADILLMSAKKDGLVNIGGFVCLNDDRLAEQFAQQLVLKEGFLHYGGMAGRDMAALAVGLRESFDIHYLEHRIAQVHWLAKKLKEAGMPVVEPVGGHAVYLRAEQLYPQIPRERLPGQVLVCEFYLEGGVRCCELGSLAFGANAQGEFVRLAIPRRTYTISHLEWVVATAQHILQKGKPFCQGFVIEYQPRFLRHFSARLRPIQ